MKRPPLWSLLLLVVFVALGFYVASIPAHGQKVALEPLQWTTTVGQGVIGPACFGDGCTSSPNVCGGTTTGVMDTLGACVTVACSNNGGPGYCSNNVNQGCYSDADCGGVPVSPPDNSTCGVCTSAPNSCGQTNSGYSDGRGGCVDASGNPVSAPANPANYGQACAAVNSCGQTNGGTIQCNGLCSASPPPNSGCPPPPSCGTSLSGGSCGFTGGPTPILPGATVTLQWYCPSSIYTSSQGDTHFSTGGALSGTATVNPTQSTTYSVTCINSAGNSTGTAAIVVNQPTLSLTSTPANRVQAGEALTITWSASNVTANSCAVTSNTAPTRWTGNSGSQQTSISAQTTFTLTCSTPAGSVSQSLTLQISPNFQEQ